ncbi:MAG: hypothetical protein IT578_00610 [Verrucomicrobiae bacterium]|nr:hypothetical protein [Verrucomicrobiae bacterium]
MSSYAADTTLHVPQARLPLMKSPPTIDGVVHDDEWAGATRMERFAGADGFLSPQEASFWVGCDGKELFIAVVSETPPGGKMLSRVTPLPENGDALTWMDDSIEMVLDPLRADPTGRRRIYHANINALGAINDTAYTSGGGGVAWRGQWRTASKVVGDRWQFEAALPLKNMNVTEADLAKPFGIRIVRNWQQQTVGPAQTEWSPLGGAYLSAGTLPLVTWDAHAPVVQVLQLHDPGQLLFRPRVAIRNEGAAPMDVKVSIYCVPKDSAHTREERTVKIPPGAVSIVETRTSTLPHEVVYGSIQVASPDGATVYYLRDFRWKLDRPDPMWALDAKAAKKVDVSFAYYPYHDTIKTIVNVTGLQERDKVTGAKISVRATGKTEAFAATPLPGFQKFAAEMEWKIPSLKDGGYEFVVELEGVKVDPFVTPFVRHVFPWEHNQLGKSDVLVEPFTPIQVEGQKLSTILRTHQLNNLGLWDQVVSEGRPLLQSPMRLEVNDKPVTGKDLRFIEKKPTRVVTESSWKERGLDGTTRSEWDYDGMMKWTLEIEPSKEAINSMTLIIPLDNKLMPLFHAVTDGLRFNYAGATPTGQGRVWDGSKAARNSIIGSYVPYIWLGAEERGFAVFGENDRGWGRNPKVPCQELVRNGDKLELRLNLVATPITIDKPRRIVIGFQATPTKPMPADWRLWTININDRPEPQCNLALLGCCYQWGALTAYDDIAPRDNDYSVFDKLAEARRTSEVDRPWLDRWIAATRFPNSESEASFRGNLNYGFRSCASKPGNVLPYTNPRGVRLDTPEPQTFLDEWHVDAFSSRKAKYGDGSTYGANPVESYRDYSVWNYQKMLATFADAIYWDNTYLKACFDTVGTDAYELSPGVIQPSVGLWNMRAIIRRTAILFHEMKKRPMNIPHMTNTSLAPTLSFAQMQLGWEDHSGDSDFQDRFSREYIRTVNIGRQHGNVPEVLFLIAGLDEKKNEWVCRTATGVALVHELRPIVKLDIYRNIFTHLVNFGYGKSDTRVFNYWQPGNPVRVEGSDVATLVVSKPGSTVVVVCDYGNGGNLTLALDPSLQFGEKIRAKNMETDQPLAVGGDGKVKFSLKKHDFMVILVETTP